MECMDVATNMFKNVHKYVRQILNYSSTVFAIIIYMKYFFLRCLIYLNSHISALWYLKDFYVKLKNSIKEPSINHLPSQVYLNSTIQGIRHYSCWVVIVRFIIYLCNFGRRIKRKIKVNLWQTENKIRFSYFSAQPNIILLLFHISQDFIGQIMRMSKFSQ